jgi:hypothetical protein
MKYEATGTQCSHDKGLLLASKRTEEEHRVGRLFATEL